MIDHDAEILAGTVVEGDAGAVAATAPHDDIAARDALVATLRDALGRHRQTAGLLSRAVSLLLEAHHADPGATLVNLTAIADDLRTLDPFHTLRIESVTLRVALSCYLIREAGRGLDR